MGVQGFIDKAGGWLLVSIVQFATAWSDPAMLKRLRNMLKKTDTPPKFKCK
jgi:hypothetical protein